MPNFLVFEFKKYIYGKKILVNIQFIEPFFKKIKCLGKMQ